MASSVTAASLTVAIKETIKLNNVDRGSSASYVQSGMGEVFNNITSVTTSGTDLIQFGATVGAGVLSTATSGAGKIDYLRITNLDAANYIDVTFSDAIAPASAGRLFSVRLRPLRSLCFSGLEFSAADGGDADNFIAAAGTIANIRATADTAACDVEVYVVSA